MPLPVNVKFTEILASLAVTGSTAEPGEKTIHLGQNGRTWRNDKPVTGKVDVVYEEPGVLTLEVVLQAVSRIADQSGQASSGRIPLSLVSISALLASSGAERVQSLNQIAGVS